MLKTSEFVEWCKYHRKYLYCMCLYVEQDYCIPIKCIIIFIHDKLSNMLYSWKDQSNDFRQDPGLQLKSVPTLLCIGKVTTLCRMSDMWHLRFFVSHSVMKDRWSTCKFRSVRNSFQKLHLDPLSFITLYLLFQYFQLLWTQMTFIC